MRANTIEPRAVEWLWWPHVPLGKLTTTAGQMGQAKSLFQIWLTGMVTRGELDLGSPASVVMLNAEDDAADTIVPRLLAADADLARVFVEPTVTLDPLRLEEICDDMGDVALISIDPIQAYLPGKVNSWKGQDVRLALEPLRQLAERRKIAVLLVQHLNRRTDAGDPLARIADSQGMPQMARSVLLFGADPSDPEGDQGAMKVLTRAKNNLARSRASATFMIVEKDVGGNITAPTLRRGRDSEITAEEVVADRETRTAAEEAAEWIQGLLRDGPVDAKQVFKRAREDGISDRTLKRVKSKVGVVSRRKPMRNGDSGGWEWRLAEGSINGTGPLDTLGTLDREKRANGAKEDNGSIGANSPLAAVYDEDGA